MNDQSASAPGAGEVLVFQQPGEWAQRAAAHIAQLLEQALASDARASLALPGGGTPRPVFAALVAHAELDWPRIDLFVGDERCVAPDSEDSNGGQLLRELVVPLGARAPRLHLVVGVERDSEAAALRYENELPTALDVLVGGIGPDGHTASLFPGHALAAPDERRVAVVRDSPKPPPERVTLTARAHREARALVMLARGADKAGAIARALEGDWKPQDCPAQLFRSGTWLLDAAAAAKLNITGAPATPLHEDTAR